MAKLFDLIVMGVKMQLVVSTKIDAPLTLALTHLRCVRELLSSTSDQDEPAQDSSLDLLEQFRQRLTDSYSRCSLGAWLSIRVSMLAFCEERRVKACICNRLHARLYCVIS